MAKMTGDDPFRALAEMSVGDSEVERLLESVSEFKEVHGREGLNALINIWERMLGISERRAAFRVAEGESVPSEKTGTALKRNLEFELYVSDEFPTDGCQCIGRVQGDGRAQIVHSRECPDADLAALRKQLEAHPAAADTNWCINV